MSNELRGIGIDLGTTYSSVGYFRNGKFQIIPNEEGDNRIPSYVAFTDRERLIGSAAKRQVTLNPNNTIFNVQRLLRRKFDDATVQADMKYMPFKVIDDRGKLKIQVDYKNETKLFTPEEILSMIFSKMKEIAETYLGERVSVTVIAVPAKFNFSQRLAIKDAGLIAGLNVRRIISGSILASIVYGIGKKTSEERKLLAFDMGGGNLNISILIIEEDMFEVKSVAGDTHLGGEDFDNRLVTHFVQEFQGRTGKTLQNNKRALQRLRTACECAKRTLSSSSQASIEIDSLFDGIDFYSTITRAYFEELCDDLFRSTLEPVKRVLRDAKIDKTKIDEIVIVGGSTRIPKVQELLQDFFNGKELNKSINSDEAVAFGAAIQAAILTGDNGEVAKNALFLNVAPFSWGVEGASGVMTVLIKRNTTIPTKQTCELTKYPDDLLNVDVKVFEGEYLMTVDNHLLGEFKLSGISRAENNTFEIEVTFDIDNCDTFIVSVTDKISGKKNQMNITDKNRLTEDEIQRMIFEAEQFQKDDTIRRECDAIKQSLELYCLNTKETLMNEKLAHKIDTNERKIILENIDKIFEWMETNKYAEKFEYEYKFKKIQTISDPILHKLSNT